MMNHMEMNDRLRPENLSTTGRYSKNADSFADHKDCQVTSSCRNDNEMIRMQLRRLWKILLNKNEKSRFEERKLCRTKTVKFLGEHVFSPCERVRYLALDLLCGTVPRLDDKTDSLLQPLAPKVIQCFSENSCREVGTKALHFLRTYARHTKSVRSFMDLFFCSGIESNSDAIRVNCLYGINVIFDQDIGDKLYSRLVLTVSSLLKGNSHPLVFLACYRVLKRIHEQIEDERFYKLLDLVDQESKVIYINFLNFEENDPYLSAEMQDLGNLISEYQRKRNSMRLNQAFGIVEPIFLNRISATRGCERAVMVENFEVAVKRDSWTEYDLESHVQDLIKLIATFLIDPNRLIQLSGLEILKEIVQRLGFHLSPYLGNIVEILLVPLTSSNIKIKSKTEKLLYKLMKNIHPMTVIWELLNEKDAMLKEGVLNFLFEALKCFPYYELDLACLFVTIGQCMEDQNPEIRRASQDCIRLLLEIMESSPVPDVKTQSIGILLRNCRCQVDTLRSVGITVADYEESREDFDSLSEMSAESTEESTMETMKGFPTVTRNSAPNQLQSQMPWNHHSYENNKNAQSFTTIGNDSFISCDGDTFSDVYLSKLTLKSTKTDKQSHATPSLPTDSRGQLQSAASQCTGEQNANSASFLTNTTYDNPCIGLPQHNSTPRRQWNVTPRGRFDAVPIASETPELSAMDTFESGNDTFLCQKGSYQTSLKKEVSVKSRIKQNAKHYAFQYADGREWSGDYSSNPHFDDDTCKGDAEAVTAKSDRKRSKTCEGMQSAGDHKSTPSIGFHLESMDPKKFNFNILQVSTPQTMESIKEIDEETNEIIKTKITEVLSSCLSTPINYEVSTRTNETGNQLNTINKKKRRQRSKFTEVRSPVTSTSSSLNDTKTEFVAKIPKRPTNKKNTDKISVGKVSLLSVQPVKSNTRKDNRLFVANNMKVPKTKGLVRPNKNKNVSASSIEEFHFLQPEVISNAEKDETLDTTLQANCEESGGKDISIMSESDINQESLEVIEFVFESEQEQEVDNTMIVEDELIPVSEFSEIVDDIMTVDEDTIPESVFSEIVDDIMALDEQTIPDFEVPASANDKLNDNAQNESNIDTSETEIARDSHLSTVDEESSEKSSPSKNGKKLTRIFGKGLNKNDTKNKTKGVSVEKTVKPKSKPVLKKMTKSTESSCHISNKNVQSSIVRKGTPKLHDRIFLNTDIQPDTNDLDNTVEKSVDEEIIDTEIPVKTKKRAAKSCKKATANGFADMLPDADDSLENAIPWKKGKELPRTPVIAPGSTKSSTKSWAKDGKKTTAGSKMNSIPENKKLSEKKKATEVKKIRSSTWKKTSPCIPKVEEADEIPERATVENTPDGEFAGCQWRRDLEYAVKGGTCSWAQKFEKMVDKMQPFQSSEVAENEMKKSLEDLNGKSWKTKEEAMSVVIRLAKHHPQIVYDYIPKIIVALCNEVKNFRQSVAGKAVLTLGYMYEYLGKKLESKLRLAVGALLAKSGNRTLAAYFRLVIKSLFKIVNSTSPQKVALAFIQEGGKHPNKASRETAAQFLALLTVTLGPSNSLTSHILAGPMIKCAAQFAFDCSALTRHCGKRMFQVLMSNPNFEKLKEHHLDINTAQDLAKVLEQIETKGVSEEFLPIKIIK